MKPEQQRIAIAEACGWSVKRYEYGWAVGTIDNVTWHSPAGFPDYINDLNAMHEAEKVLWDTGNAMEFTNQLVGIVCAARGFRWDKGTPDDHLMCLSHANAAQRAEAFLRTLDLWEESE